MELSGNFDNGRFGFKIHLFGREIGYEKYYKESLGSNFCHITFDSFILHKHIFLNLLLFSLTLTTQSQLLGSSGDNKNGEGAQKRLKILVPHFNNSDLIKDYSKTLIGICMNPEEQNTKYLIVTLPKIWNMEERVIGADLGLGRFQFDFDEEEYIETVLKIQPLRFDYWMIYLVRWQPRKNKNYPSEITFWIKVLGVLLEFWEAPTFPSIGDAIGEIKVVDLDYGRVQVVVDGFKEFTLRRLWISLVESTTREKKLQSHEV